MVNYFGEKNSGIKRYQLMSELEEQQTASANPATKTINEKPTQHWFYEVKIMMNISEEQVRKHAYQIWESEGRPQNQAQRHWEMAQKVAASQSQLEHQDRSNTSKSKARSTTKSRGGSDIAAASKATKTPQKQNQKIAKAELVEDVIKTEVPPVDTNIGV